MTKPLALEDVFARLQSGDWDAIKELEARFGVSEDARRRRELGKAEADQLAGAAASIPDVFLQWLIDQTWGRMTFSVMSNPDPGVAQQYGVFREGQNALALTILQMVAAGRHADEVRPARTKPAGRRSRVKKPKG